MSNANPLGRDHPDPRHDNQATETFGQTPWQTVGPFFHYALPWKGAADLVGVSALGARPDLFPATHDTLHATAHRHPVAGEAIEIRGRVLAAAGAPVPDAMIEMWQANAAGRYASPADPRTDLPLDEDFSGFGRSSTSVTGDYIFRTIMPGRVPGPGNTLQAPHIAIGVFGRGILKRLVTRLYFAGHHGNTDDPILDLVPATRRHTLVARQAAGHWQFDIHLQGESETVFFDL
jgi:protocatechuate 3,4-dioxygenase alpha subunit